jgi:hypothetical protein
MVTIKYDVSGADHKANRSDQGEFVQPPKGLYIAKLVECNKGFSKDGDGKPDKSRPRLECIYQIVAEADGSKPDKQYSRLWDYVSFSDAAEWKLDQFLQAMGIDTENQEAGKAEIETGKLVKVRVRPDTDQHGDYRAKVGALFHYDADEDDDLSDALDDDDADDDDEAEVDEWEDDDDDEAEDEPGWTAEDIDNLDNKGLKDLVKELGVKPKKGSKVSDVRALAKAELGLDEDDDDDVPF